MGASRQYRLQRQLTDAIETPQSAYRVHVASHKRDNLAARARVVDDDVRAVGRIADLLDDERAAILDREGRQHLEHLHGNKVLLRHELRGLVLQELGVAVDLGEDREELLRVDLRGAANGDKRVLVFETG